MGNRKLKTIRIISLIAIFAISIILPATALALDGTPDGTPSVENLHGFQNLIEDGDAAIFGEYIIPYSVLPTVPASRTYSIMLIDADGEIKGVVKPFDFFDYGYNLGAFGLYFSPSDNVTPGDVYEIRIAQSPAYFDTPEYFDYDLPAQVWLSDETQDSNRTGLSIAVISTAERLEKEYTEYTLLESGASGTVLYSPTGEMYFRGAFYGIQIMAPSLFLYQVLPYDGAEERIYTDNMSDNYTGRFTGTWVETDIEATAEQFGLTPQAIMAMAFSLPVCLGFIIVSAKKFHKTEPGFLVSALVILITYMMGWMPAAIFASIYQISGIYLAYVWFYARG